MEFQQMQFGSVTFMLAEAILGELSAKVTHHTVARDLGDDAGGSDAQADAIAVDDGRLRKWKRDHRQPVDQNVFGLFDQGFDRQAHRLMARAQNIDAIDLDGIDRANCPSDFRIGRQIRINFLAQFRRKLFGIVQATMTKFLRKDYSSGDNWTRQGTTPSFVNPGDLRDAGGAEFFFVTKSASPIHLRKSLADLRD
jgi:hypothetical protein